MCLLLLFLLLASKRESELTPLCPSSSACNVFYLNSVETESLTGPQAIAKATDATLGRNLRPSATVVQFKVTSQGITLTDNQRRYFGICRCSLMDCTYRHDLPEQLLL